MTTIQNSVMPQEQLAPGERLIPFSDLKEGNEFRYQGSDPTEWCRVTSLTDQQINYSVGRSHIPQSNWRHAKSVFVIKREGVNS